MLEKINTDEEKEILKLIFEDSACLWIKEFYKIFKQKMC